MLLQQHALYSSRRCWPAQTVRCHSCTVQRHTQQSPSPVQTTLKAVPTRGTSVPAARRTTLERCRQVMHAGAAAAQELHTGLWADEGEQWYKNMLQRFEEADADGNGVIDRDELQALLEGFEDGKAAPETHWLTDEEVSKVLQQYDTEGNGSINLKEFEQLAKDGVLLHGSIKHYSEAFEAVDSDHDGLVTAEQLSKLFGAIDSKSMDANRIAAEFERYDIEHTGTIGFYEFLRMFRSSLLDLESVIDYLHQSPPAATQQPAPEASVDGVAPGEVVEIQSEEELDAIIAADDRPVCLLAGFTWCRPCKSLQMPFQKLAKRYENVKMLKFYGNANENTKSLFRDRLKARATPTIAMFNSKGELGHMHTGANKAKLEFYLREFIEEPEDSEREYPEYQLTEREREDRANKAA